MEKKTRVRRPIEEREAELDTKIKYHEDCIASLKARIENLRAPRATRMSYKAVITQLKESGRTPEEILEFLQK